MQLQVLAASSRLAVDKYDGQCGVLDDTRFREHAETKTYFVEVAGE